MVHDAIADAPYVSFRFLNLMALTLARGNEKKPTGVHRVAW